MLDKKFKANLNFGLATNISVLNVGHAVSGVWLKLYSCGGGGGGCLACGPKRAQEPAWPWPAR